MAASTGVVPAQQGPKFTKMTHGERARRRQLMGEAVLRGERIGAVAVRFRVCMASVRAAAAEVQAAKDAAFDEWYRAKQEAERRPQLS